MKFIFIRNFKKMPHIDKSREPANVAMQKTLSAEWQLYFPGTVVDDATDFEDFWEYAATFLSVLRQGHDCWIMESTDINHLTPVLHDRPAPSADDGPLIVMGAFKIGLLPEQMHQKMEFLAETDKSWPKMAWPVVQNVRVAQKYAFSETFKKHAGRRVKNAGLPSDANGEQVLREGSLYDRHWYCGEYAALRAQEAGLQPAGRSGFYDYPAAYEVIKEYHDTQGPVKVA
jgi:hypothetical protein